MCVSTMLFTKSLQRIIETHGMAEFEPVFSEFKLYVITTRLPGLEWSCGLTFYQIFMFAAMSQRNINGFLISWAWTKAEEVFY